MTDLPDTRKGCEGGVDRDCVAQSDVRPTHERFFLEPLPSAQQKEEVNGKVLEFQKKLLASRMGDFALLSIARFVSALSLFTSIISRVRFTASSPTTVLS